MSTTVGGLLERDAELDAIRDLLRDARSGDGQLGLIEAPAGIGKTALVTAARAIAADDGFEVLTARGGELERDFPFGLARQLFEPALERLEPADREVVTAGAAAHADLALGSTAQGDDGAIHTALHGLYWLTANLAERTPLLLVVDDAHWGDVPSLRLLNYLARRLDGVALAVLVAARPVSPEPAVPLLDELRREPGIRRIELAPLSRDGVRDLVEHAFGTEPEEEFVQECVEQTAGNPLLAQQLAQALVADDARPDASTAARLHTLPPREALRSVLVRIGRLAPAASALAQAIAVLEKDARLGDAAALAGLDESTAARAADDLVATGILVSDPLLSFAHPLLRAAVYEDIPAARRATDHARAATLLRADPAMRERVTAHLLACEPTGEEWVLTHLRASAREALARGAAETAVAISERCLAERPTGEKRAGIVHELGFAQLRLGRPEALEHLREAYDTTTDPVARITIARELAGALTFAARVGDAHDLLEATLAEVPADNRELALIVEGELLAASLTGPGLAERVSDRVAAIPPLAGDTPGERLLLANVARYLDLTGASQVEAAATAERAIAGGQLLYDQTPDTPTFVMAQLALIARGRHDFVRDMCNLAIEDARRRGSPLGVGMASTVVAYAEEFSGNLLAAESAAQTGLELSRQAGLVPGIAGSVRVLVEVAIERGRLDEADAVLADNFLDGELPDAWVFFDLVLFARGSLRLAQGRAEEGIADLLELGRREQASGYFGPAPWRSVVAVPLAAQGDADRAHALAAEELALARQRDGPGLLGYALRALAHLEGGEAGIERLREAVRALEPTGWRLEYTRSLAELGAALRRANQRAEARDHLRVALDLAHRCGATVLAEQTNQELLATGARPRKVMLSGVDSLTASERRVADLAAEGMTNKQIAQALFVTHKTVATHLAHTYSKLDIASRSELAAALAGS
jgi:DNA-binding CsgD family transcriptional regulator